MKQIIIDEFNSYANDLDIKKMPLGTFKDLQNVTNENGNLSRIDGDLDISDSLPVPVLATGFTIDKTEDDLMQTFTNTRTGVISYIMRVVLPVDVVANKSLITVGCALRVTELATPDVAGRGEAHLVTSGVLYEYINSTTVGALWTVSSSGIVHDEEPETYATPTNRASLKMISMSCSQNLSAGTAVWLGIKVSTGLAVNSILLPKQLFVNAPALTYTLTDETGGAGVFGAPASFFPELFPLFHKTLENETVTGDSYLFKTLQLPAPLISLNGADLAGIAPNLLTADVTPNVLGSETKYANISIPTYTPVIIPTSSGSKVIVFVQGLGGAGYMMFGGGTEAILVGADMSTDNKVIIGVTPDGIIFITYPYAQYCVPLGFSPYGFDPQRHFSAEKRKFSAVAFTDFIVWNCGFNSFSRYPAYVSTKRLIDVSASFPTVGASPQGGPQFNYMRSTSLLPDARVLNVITETLAIWGFDANPSQLAWSTRGEVDSFDSYTAVSEGYPITAVVKFNDTNLVCFDNEIHRFRGSPDGSFSYQKIADFGVTSERMITSCNGVAYLLVAGLGFLSYNGVFKVIYNDDEVISSRTLSWDRDEESFITHIRHKSEILFKVNLFYTYAYNLKTKQLSKRDSGYANCIECNLPLTETALAIKGGNVVMLQTGGTNYPRAWLKTGAIRSNIGLDDTMFKDLYLNMEGEPDTIKVVVRYYNGSSVLPHTDTFTDVLTSTDGEPTKLRLDRSARYIQLEIDTVDADVPFTLHDLIITTQDGNRR